MGPLSPFELLLVKQTCRCYAHEFEMGPDPDQSPEEEDDPTNIYSLDFLKQMYESPAEKVNEITKYAISEKERNASEEVHNLRERQALLNFMWRLNDVKSETAQHWLDIQHYLCCIYRQLISTEPDPEQEVLSPFFVSDMRNLICRLMEEDEVQLCLRLFSLMREYTKLAQKQHQKITDVEVSVENLFYYYEAFLSGTKNVIKIFPESEKLLINTYKLGWLDFNTSIFMYYFYETPHVQNMLREFELVKDKVSIKAAGIYTVLTELHKLWRSQMLGINEVLANKLGTKFKGLGTKTMAAHKRLLSKNFWIDRSQEEKDLLDMQIFDYQLFTLVEDKNLDLPEPTLDENGRCICEDCLLAEYKNIVEAIEKKSPASDLQNRKTDNPVAKITCRFCKELTELDRYQQHINVHARVKMAKNSPSNKLETNKADLDDSYMEEFKQKLAEMGPLPDFLKDIPDYPLGDTEDDVDYKLISYGANGRRTRKTLYSFLKLRKMLVGNVDDVDNKRDIRHKKTVAEKSSIIAKSLPKSNPPAEPKPSVDIHKSSKGTNTSNKNTGVTFPCGHSCKLEEEIKSEFKKAYQETCDHHKETKKCDCTFCEVFGTTSHSHKTNETRNRLRIRLNQKFSNKMKANSKQPANNVTSKNPINKAETPVQGVPKLDQLSKEALNGCGTDEGATSKPPINDIHGLLNYIEGNTTTDKVALAEKKAAKKARQREKKEQEKQKLEEDERKKLEEEKRLLEERLRNEELERQLLEKAKNSKKEGKKKKQKNKNKENEHSETLEETIPAVVTIKRVVENHNSVPTVTITLKGSTPDQDKLLYTLVNGNDTQPNINNSISNNKDSNKKNKNSVENAKKTVNSEVNTSNNSKNNKKKNKNDRVSNCSNQMTNNIITKELKVTLAVDPNHMIINDAKKSVKQGSQSQGKQADQNKTSNNSKKPVEIKKESYSNISTSSKNIDFNIPMLRLPPGITITKVEGPTTDKSFKTNNADNSSYNSSIPVSKSGVIVVDTEKLIKQSSVSTTTTVVSSKKSKKKRNKKNEPQQFTSNHHQPAVNGMNGKPSMVTLKNPIFHNMQQPNGRREPEVMPDIVNGQCQQASIFKNENGMVTIRSSRLQQSMSNGSPMPNLLSDLKPVLGPEVNTPYISPCNLSETSRISPFNAQEILSGLPGIEITKVDKNSTTRRDLDDKKSCHTAEVSIIPANNVDKFNFDKDDLLYDSVFTPKDVLEDDLDADELELEAFKRFCQQSVPPKRKEKVAHLNVKDIILKKKNDEVSG